MCQVLFVQFTVLKKKNDWCPKKVLTVIVLAYLLIEWSNKRKQLRIVATMKWNII